MPTVCDINWLRIRLISKGANRKVLSPIIDLGRMCMAWCKACSKVRALLVCWGGGNLLLHLNCRFISMSIYIVRYHTVVRIPLPTPNVRDQSVPQTLVARYIQVFSKYFVKTLILHASQLQAQ